MNIFPKVVKDYNAHFFDESGRYTILEKCVFCFEIMQEYKINQRGKPTAIISTVGNYLAQPVYICLGCYNKKFNENLEIEKKK